MRMINDRPYLEKYIKEFDFESLFLEEMGWSTFDIPALEVLVDRETFLLRPIANLGSFAAFECSGDSYGNIPGNGVRKKVEKILSKDYRENLIIFVNRSKSIQVWQWVKRESNREVNRYIRYSTNQSTDLLVQKVKQMSFSLNELGLNGNVSLLEVRGRVSDALDVERVTRGFYDKFTKVRKGFGEFIKGIPDTDMQDWYISVILNRLMFIYFIQKKGYLNGDLHYLETKLNEINSKGKDFYKDFLTSLFFKGFAMEEKNRDFETNKLLGKIPYLNGGLFAKHQLEIKFPDISIDNNAFSRIFDFFQEYDWHLDTNPLRKGNEINPDVIGYIFEKYVNQKQTGAYYTQEDITEYMSRNTIISYLMECVLKLGDSVKEKIISLLEKDPDRYLLESIKTGIEKEIQTDLVAGVEDVSKRGNWNNIADIGYANPSELWREVIERREKYHKIIQIIQNGKAREIDDFIKYNIDVLQLFLDYIEQIEMPDEMYNVYEHLNSITVLDPTCGSGAFLFSALNILKTLYQSLIERMEVKLGDWELEGAPGYEEFVNLMEGVIDNINLHPNKNYFIYKSIIVNNLYGVDIMEEATEICKLRLFLKLIAQTENANSIEPLPDIDFNIRAGNMLVGFSTIEEAKQAIRNRLDFDNVEEKVEKNSREIAECFKEFQMYQNNTTFDSKKLGQIKSRLNKKLMSVSEVLDRYLAREQYGIEPDDHILFKNWKEKHLPLHWFCEFYEIINKGGFDIVIGNPPYIQKRKLDYAVNDYRSGNLQDIYAPCVERSVVQLLRKEGFFSMIVPISSVSTPDYEPLRKVIEESNRHCFAASFGERPSKLFNGADKRVTIFTATSIKEMFRIYTTKYRRWLSVERPALLEDTQYVEVEPNLFNISCYPKVNQNLEKSILDKLKMAKKSIMNFQSSIPTDYPVRYTRKLRYFIQFFIDPPKIFNEKNELIPPSELKNIYFTSRNHQLVVLSLLNSNLFFWYFISFSDCRNVNLLQIKNFPLDINKMDETTINVLSELALEFLENLEENSTLVQRNDQRAGTLNIQSFRPRYSKSVIDEIDKELGKYYGFTEEEIDFIINHDIKYRMGITSRR